jgi:lysophospholipase
LLEIANLIERDYQKFAAFVVFHQTETLAYTSSALSFLLHNLAKTVIVTGAMIISSQVRSDAAVNLEGALFFAGNFKIPEVLVFFNKSLMRGNRVINLANDTLAAFDSPNFEPVG